MAVPAVRYGEPAPRVEQALRAEFPADTIKLSEGYRGRVHVLIVSQRLDGLSERAKQDLVWDVLRRDLGPDAADVALVIAYGTDEL